MPEDDEAAVSLPGRSADLGSVQMRFKLLQRMGCSGRRLSRIADAGVIKMVGNITAVNSEVFQQHHIVYVRSLGEGEGSTVRGGHNVVNPSRSPGDFVQDS